MKIVSIFTVVGSLLVGLVIGVPVLGSIFATDGPYQDLNDLTRIGTECVYGPGNTIYIPDQTGFDITTIDVTPIAAEATYAVTGAQTPVSVPYTAGQIEMVNAEATVISTAAAGVAYTVDEQLVGVAAAGSSAYDCDPADGTHIAGAPITETLGSCVYGNPSDDSYNQAIGGALIVNDSFKFIRDDQTITVDGGTPLLTQRTKAGDFTIGSLPVAEGDHVWSVRGVDSDGESGNWVLAFSVSTTGGPLGTACNVPGGNIPMTNFQVATNPSVVGNVVMAVDAPDPLGNVAIRSGGTGLTDSPYRGILVAIIALIPLLAVGFFAFRFFVLRSS